MLKNDFRNGKFYAKCDNCDHYEVLIVKRLMEGAGYLKRSNWFITKNASEFEHYCPKCVDSSKRLQRMKKAAKETYSSKAAPKVINGACSICKGDMVLRDGKFGPFYGCQRFPSCKATLNMPFVMKHLVK